MKRAWTKKIKAVPACAAGKDTLEGHLKPVGPVKRRVRTSAAMIGLAFSMGASSLLLTRQSDRAPAAEPVGNAPTISMVPAATAVSTPETTPLVEHAVQKKQTLRQLSEKYQVDAAALSSGVNRSQITPAATAASQQLLVDELRKVAAGEVNGAMLAKQRVTLNRLKQKSNRLKEVLAQLRSEESHNSSAPARESAEPSSAVEKAQSTNQGSIAPLVVGATTGQQQAAKRSKEVATNTKSVVKDLEKSQDTPRAAAKVVTDLPKSAVNTPTVVVASVTLDYRVKAGDTLSAIAHKHGISLKELINANHLTAPDWLQINQRLTIPAFKYSSAAGQTIAVIKRPIHPETPASSVAVATLKMASSNPIIPLVPPLPPSANKISVSVPTLPTTGSLQANAESIWSNPAGGSQQKSASVPLEPLAGTPSLGAAVYGIGGSISDETAHESPPTFDKIQLAQLTAAKPEKPQSNPYVQNLQIDIQRLQQKYYAQQTVSQVVPKVSETGTVAAPQQVPVPSRSNSQFRLNLPANQLPTNPGFRSQQAAQTLKPAIQKRRPTQAKSPVPPRARVATAPNGIDASESLQSLREKQVSPELPPLAAVDTYMPKPFDNSARFKGYIWPTKGVLSSGYGWRWGRMHKGIDIAAPIGTPVVAAAPGVVIKAGWNSGGYGRLVDIKHPDGTFTRYAHNNRILVHAGQQVEQGEQISEMGSSGRSTGPHLHFEVHPGGKGAVNPIAFLKRK